METPSEFQDIAQNLQSLNQAIAKACARAMRAPKDITLVAVSKFHDVDEIRMVIKEGQRCFGENRVQEAQSKWPDLRLEFPDLRLHLIGPLQTNKVKQAVALFDVIETVDRVKLARALSVEFKRVEKNLPVLIQVNTGEEPQKAGVFPHDVDGFVTQCRDEFGLVVKGLMCIPPQNEEPAMHFALLNKLATRNGLDVLSMGMSGDFETAIDLGATHIRVGTAIFGKRPGP